jgi:cytochrome c-type protein NapB
MNRSRAVQEIAMKPRTRILVAVAVVSLIHAGCAYRSEESASNEPEPTASVEQVADSELGLEKSSVFDTPDPEPANFTAVEPGENPLRGAYFDESPPMISHSIEDMLPIRFGENMCMDCHDMPDMIGDELEPGDPTPIPVSHYTDLRFAPDKVTDQVIGARFTCTQCHAPQADNDPPVANTYSQ